MTMGFTIDTREIDRYAKHLETMKRSTLHVAFRMMMNNMAFGVRREAIENVNRTMIVRNPRFLSATIRVDKARAYKDVALLYNDSKKYTRYEGLREQEFGGVMGRQVATLASRGKNKTKKMQQKSRLKQGHILQPSDIEPRGKNSDQNRTHVFLKMLQRKTGALGGHKGAFIIPKSKGFKKGQLVRMGKLHPRGKDTRKRKDTRPRKLISLQTFSKGKKRVSIRRWMRPAIKTYLRRTDANKEWGRIMRALIHKHARSFK